MVLAFEPHFAILRFDVVRADRKEMCRGLEQLLSGTRYLWTSGGVEPHVRFVPILKTARLSMLN